MAADATVADARRAIAAARRAFDTTDWSRDHALRVRCLRQLHQALRDNVEPLREILVHEVGAPVSSTSGPQLEAPIDVVALVRRPARGLRVRRGPRRARHVRGPAPPLDREGGRRRRRRDRGVQLPDPARAREARARRSRPGCTVVLKGAPDTPWATLALGKLDRRGDRHPARRRERAHVVRQRGRRRADDAPRRRRRVVHRLDAGRPPDHGGGERHREARVPRARRQVGVRACSTTATWRWPRCSARTPRPRTRARAARSRRASSCRATGYDEVVDVAAHDARRRRRTATRPTRRT